jgi:hypothetical protein
VKQIQAVAAHDLVVGIDLNRGEEGINRGAEFGHCLHRGGEILGRHGGGNGGFGQIKGGEEGALFVSFSEFDVCAEGVFDAVLSLGLAENRVGAFVALQEVGAIFGFEEGGKGGGAIDEERQVIVARHGEAGVDDVVADALVFEEYLEAVVEEGEQILSRCDTIRCGIQ